MQESFWWWQCSDRYIISLFPHLYNPLLPFSPSLISLMVSVDVKHHVYLTYLPDFVSAGLWSCYRHHTNKNEITMALHADSIKWSAPFSSSVHEESAACTPSVLLPASQLRWKQSHEILKKKNTHTHTHTHTNKHPPPPPPPPFCCWCCCCCCCCCWNVLLHFFSEEIICCREISFADMLA